MIVILHFNQSAFRLKILNDLFAAFIAVHTAVFAPALGNMAVIRHNIYDLQIMTEADFIVIRIMRGCDLYNAGAELNVHIIIGNNRNLSVHDRQNQRFADDILIAVIIWIYGNRRIAEHGLRPCGGKLNIAAAIFKRITQMPEMACLILVLHFRVRNRGFAVRAPVYHSFALIDQTFIVEIYKDFLNGFGTAFVHRETFPVPITGRAHFFKLFYDS